MSPPPRTTPPRWAQPLEPHPCRGRLGWLYLPLPMYSLGPIYRFTVGGQGRGVEGAPLLPRPPGVRAEGSRWWPGASCPWGDLGGESWSAPGLGGWAGAAGFGAGCWQAGSAPRSSRLWGRKRFAIRGLSSPKAGRADSSILWKPEPPTRVLGRGWHTPAARPADPRTGRAPRPPPALVALETRLCIPRDWIGHWCVTTDKIRAPQVTAGPPFPSTVLAVAYGGALLGQGLWSPYNRLFGGLRPAPPLAGLPDRGHPFVGPHFPRLAIPLGPRTVPERP